jgi:spectinomycin phosphotransferase
MREPPIDLSPESIRAALRAEYHLEAAELAFLPLGHDSSAWVYRARTPEGATYFLKARLAVENQAALVIPRHLHAHGVAQVAAPVPSVSGALWVAAGSYGLILYPFIAGRAGMEGGMAEGQWAEYGAALRQIHAAPVAAELLPLLRRESFTPAGSETVRQVDAAVDRPSFDEPLARELAGRWRERRELILRVLARAEELGRAFERTAPELVICHADIHTNNVLLDEAGRAWIVDWDEVMLAPKERDLMFAMGGGISAKLVGPREEAWFLRGYGPPAASALGLAFYRYAWAVSDTAAYAAEVLFRPDLGAVTKRAAIDTFASLFEPGEIVSLALASEETL